MSARQTLAVLGATGATALALVVALAWRLAPCLPVRPICWEANLDQLCRLLTAAGVRAEPAVVGWLFLAAIPFLPLLTLVAMVDQWQRTTAFVQQVRRRLVTPLPADLAALGRSVGLHNQLELVDLPRPLAFVHGIRRPTICLSTGLVRQLNASELRAVLRHEQVHLEAGDPCRVLIGHGLATMLFWLPLAGDLAAHLRVASEVEADAAVARQPADRRALASALGKLLAASTDVGLGSYAVTGLTATERRIDALLEGQARASFVWSASRAAISGALALTLLCLLVL